MKLARQSAEAKMYRTLSESRAVELLRPEFHRNLTVTEVADEVGVHPLRLSRVFRQFHHQSIGEYTHRLRIHFACQRLSTAETPLANVAAEAGFADQSHFTRVFKQIIGLTPGAFQKAARAGSLRADSLTPLGKDR